MQLIASLLFLSVESGLALNLLGSYDGSGSFFKFSVNESQPLGGDVTSYHQINRIDIQEQEGSFVRGAEYWSTDGASWFFVCYIFGEISQKSNQPNVYSVRLQEYFNKVNTSNPHDQAETLGQLVGYYDTETSQMHVDYTGQTLSMQMFGAQSFVATKTSEVAYLERHLSSPAADVIGDYDLSASLSEFAVNVSVPLGTPIISYNVTSRISIQEQNDSFVRGIEYQYDYLNEKWVLYCNFFGVIAQKSHQSDIYTVRLQQFLNSENVTQPPNDSVLLGQIIGYFNITTDIMQTEYVGQTLSLQNFGGRTGAGSPSSTLPSFPSSGSSLNIIGFYDGSGNFSKFSVNESQPLGGDVTSFHQINRIDIQEQEGSFVRGAEYWSTDGASWFFVCYIFGEISQKSNQPNVYSVRLQEYFNKVNTSNPHDQAETLGQLVGYYDTETSQMHVDYTGQTLSMQMFGAQSFVATKIGTGDDEMDDDNTGGGGGSSDDETDDLPGGWITVSLLCVFGGGFVLVLIVYKLHDYYDAFGIKARKEISATEAGIESVDGDSMNRNLL